MQVRLLLTSGSFSLTYGCSAETIPTVRETKRRVLRHLLQPVLRTLSNTQRPACLLFALAASATVVASPPGAPTDSASVPSRTLSARRWFQIGKATFYGRGFQGKRTATGEPFNMNAFTCAHPTLPLGSWLRVTNLRNRRFTFVRVNDRGPYAADAIVDLSYAAAQRVGLLGKGQVRVERVNPQDPELANALVAELATSGMLLQSQP